jgi:hypothetical protein
MDAAWAYIAKELSRLDFERYRVGATEWALQSGWFES